MSSEQLADGVNPLDAELAATWDVLKGYSGRDTDLGIARRFGGAAAAYSLRDIGAMNGSVVRVRREPNDTTAGIDDEERFSANQVQDGTLERWVNGELESTLPADVDAAAAAYSLRKVKASYSGDAVRIRRDSDGIEVNVAFDSDDKVSASSSVTDTTEEGGEIGSTTATDLNGFLNETLTVGVAVEGGASASDRPDSFTNATNSSFTATVTATAGGYFPYKTAIGDVITVSFDLELSGGASPSACTSTSINTINNASPSITYTTSGSYTSSFTCTADATHFRFADGDDGTFAVTNFRIVSHTHSAFVHTWYDQAGSNDATQTTAANQPKIAEDGALLADGIDFDGSDDFLESTGLTSIYTGTDTVSSAFVVVNTDVASTTQYIIGAGNTSASNPFYNTLFHSGNNLGWQVRDDAGTLKSNLTATPYIADKMYLVSNVNSGTTTDFNSNAVIIDNGADSNVGAKTINTVKLGARGNAASNPLNGSIKEAIFYATDQSANRFKIESNINNYYGLYNDANETNGDFDETFSPTADGTFTPNGKDGFTLAVVSSTVYAGIKLNEDVASGDSIYVSFNCSFDAGSPSPKIVLRNTDSDFFGGGILMSNEESVVNGFNSFTLTSTNSSASGVVLSEADDNLTYSISNFKVSRIARNGFVETWYDQSGNGNDASQASANSQPYIISNGNQVTLDNSTPSIAFERITGYDTLTISTPLANEPYTFFATTVNNASNAWFRLFGESNAAPTVLLRNNNTIEYRPSDSDVSGAISATTTSDNIVSGFSGVNGGADGILRFNGTNLKTDISRTQDGDSINLIGRFPNTGTGFAYIESLVFYESDLTADFDTIEKELAQPINIL